MRGVEHAPSPCVTWTRWQTTRTNRCATTCGCVRALAHTRLAGDALTAAVRAMQIELVLTAHPTEIVRRTLLQSQRRIADRLALRDRPDLTSEERDAALAALRPEHREHREHQEHLKMC